MKSFIEMKKGFKFRLAAVLLVVGGIAVSHYACSQTDNSYGDDLLAAPVTAFDKRLTDVIDGKMRETTRQLCTGVFDANFKYGSWSKNRTWAEVTRKLLTASAKDADQRRRVLDELRERTGTATVSNAELPDAVQAVYGKFNWKRIGGFCGAGRDSTPALKFLQAVRAELREVDAAYADEVFDQLVK